MKGAKNLQNNWLAKSSFSEEKLVAREERGFLFKEVKGSTEEKSS